MEAQLVIDVIQLIGMAVVVPLALARPWSWRDPASALVAGFGLVAAIAFAASRSGVELFGIGEPIVQLTGIHFTFAGVGALTLAADAGDHRLPAWSRLADAAVLGTAVAPPVVALGFIAEHPMPQVGGALLMSVGALGTAALQLAEARGDGPLLRRRLLGVSGLAPWAAMVLAVGWAASNYWAVPALSIPDMARTHGVLNATFVVVGLVARRFDRNGRVATSLAVAS